MIFSCLCEPMVSHWSLCDSKSPQVSRIVLRILPDLNNAVVWMVSARHLISISSSSLIIITVITLHLSSYFQVLLSLYQSFGDCTLSTTYIWYHHHFLVPQFFQFPREVDVFIFLFTFFQFISVVSRDSKSTIQQILFFCCCWLLLSLVVWLRLGDPFVSQNPGGVYTSHSSGQFPGCVYTSCSYGQISISYTIPCE